MSENEQQTVVHFEGTGSRKTKPFQIPEGVSFFSFSWTMSAGNGEIEINSIENPNDPLDVVSAEFTGESVYYGNGTYYFSINTSGPWEIDVYLDADAWSESEMVDDKSESSDEVTEQSFRNPNWQPASLSLADWYFIYAPYSKEIVAQIKMHPVLNFVDDLHRGYIIDNTQQVRLNISQRSVSKISDLVLELDTLMRESVPDLCDNYPNGAPTFVSPLDERIFNRATQKGLKIHLSISNLLRKEGSNAFFNFANGEKRVQFIRVSSAHSVDQRQANREAAAVQWEQIAGPRRSASAWFDEAKRRGF